MSLRNRVAIVTGGGRGIALGLAAEGGRPSRSSSRSADRLAAVVAA